MDTSDNPQPEQKPDWRDLANGNYYEDANDYNNDDVPADSDDLGDSDIYGDSSTYDADTYENPEAYDNSDYSDYPEDYERPSIRLSDITSVYKQNKKGGRWLLASMGLIILVDFLALFLLYLTSNSYQFYMPLSLTVAIWAIAYTSRKYLSTIQEPSKSDVLVYSVATSIVPSIPFIALAVLSPCDGMGCLGNGLIFIAGLVVIPILFVASMITASINLRLVKQEEIKNDDNLQPSISRKEKTFSTLANVAIVFYLVTSTFAEYSYYIVLLRPVLIAVLIYAIVAIVKNRADRSKMAKVIVAITAPMAIEIVLCISFMSEMFYDILIRPVYNSFWPQGVLIMIARAVLAVVFAKFIMKYIGSDKETKLPQAALVTIAVIEIILQTVIVYVSYLSWR